MTDDDDWPCRPWTGRRLWTLRCRHWLARHAFRLAHRLFGWSDHLEAWTWRLRWHYDDSELGRLVHDQRYHDRELPKWERVTSA